MTQMIKRQKTDRAKLAEFKTSVNRFANTSLCGLLIIAAFKAVRGVNKLYAIHSAHSNKKKV